jgi:membrane associated rhomboid family serine protease/tetratricopeptide (TPR) repeat protein
VFIAMVVSGVPLGGTPTTKQILAWGADSGPLVADGQWWRLVTSAFVHIGLIHLGVNMLALRSLSVVERLFGRGGFAFIYFASAVGASATSILWRPANVSAGASGALFGLLGALFAFFLAHRRIMPSAVSRPMFASLLFTIGINVVLGLSIQFIDNAAHLGGLATGFLAGLCLNRELVPAGPGSPAMFVAKPSRKPLLRATLLAFAILAAAALIPVRVGSDPRISESTWLREAREAMEEKNYAEAEEICTHAIASNPDLAKAHELKAWCRSELHDPDGAMIEADRALELDGDLVNAHYLRWQLRRAKGDVDGELHDLDRLVDLSPDSPESYRARGHALYAAGRWKESRRDFQTLARLVQKDQTLALIRQEESGEAEVYIWLANARLGLREQGTQELKRYSTSFEAGEMSKLWRRIVLVAVGEAEPSSLQSFEDGVEGEPDSSCRALFFLASLALLDHADRADLLGKFDRCLYSCAQSEEHWSARAEIERLRK